MSDSKLIYATKVSFANSFAYYLKSSNFHWNVEGIFFQPLHELFGKFYLEVHQNIDAFAEQIRILGDYTPGDLTTLHTLSEITETSSNTNPSAVRMLQTLRDDNNIIIERLKANIELAEVNSEFALSDFLANQLEIHQKQLWMINATLKEYSQRDS
jgi:starvation-inducible DNA-binding protein